MSNEYSIFDKQIGLDGWLQKGSSETSFVNTINNSSPSVPSVSNQISNSPSLSSVIGGETGAILSYAKKSFTDTTEGWIQGLDTDGTYKWLIGGSSYSIDWNVTTANVLTVIGSITATTGAIGGFEIGSDYIRDAANSFGLASTATSATELFGSTLFSDANLVSYWRFEASSGDSKGSNNGTDTAITYSSGNGKFNNGAGFNGTSSQIYSQSSSFDTSGTSNFTIAVWVRLTALPTGATSYFDVVMTQEAADTATYDKGLRVYGNGSASFYAYDGATKEAASAASAVVAGTYTSLIGTYDGTTLRLYINGTLAGSIACSSTYNFTTPRLVFGHKVSAASISEYLYGAIDDAAYFSRALSASEIANLAGGDDVRFWAGASYASRATAPARITEAGVATFTSGTVGGWTLSSTTLVGGNATLSSTGVLTLGTSNDVAIVSAADATYRLWVGHATAASGPFRVTKAGALTATSATISGAITATSGSITGAFTIGSGGSFSSGQTAYDTGTGFWLEYNAGTPRFSIGNSAGNKLLWNGTTLAITGTITASAGAIGGWTIGATTLTGGDATLSSTGFLNLGTSNDIVKLSSVDATYRLWVGHATAASAPFSVTKAGAIAATSGAIGGWTLSATTLTATSIVLDAGNQKITVGSGTPNLVIDGANNQMGTSTFVSGQSGWRITGSGNAEFNNIVARGEFRTAVFVKDEIHATGGTMIVLTASTLYADATTVTTPTTSTIDIQDPPSGHAQLFSVNDILRIKDGSGKDNWLKVTAVSDQTTFYRYTVDKQSGTNGTFYKGTAVVNYRTATDGFVLLTSDLSNGPYIDIGLSSATPWSGTTAKARLGNLAGITDSTFGALTGFGLWTNNGYFTGSVFATAGYFGDATTRVAIEAAGITVGTTGSIRAGQTAYDTGTGFWIGQVTGTPKFSIGNSAGNKLTWDGTTLSITGSLTATTGAIGGFTIGSDYIRDAADSFGLASTVTVGDDVRFWAGAAFASRSTAPFRITEAGVATMTSATIGSWTINSTSIYTGTEDHSGYTTNAGDITLYSNGTDASIHAKNFYIDTAGVLTCTAAVISGGITTTSGSSLDGQYLTAASVASAAANLSLRGWTQTCVFSVSDADTVAWGSGTLIASDGTSYSIGAGNTGNMAAKTYIYLDIAVSTTAYQTTTTATTAIGNGKVLVAIAQNATTEATFMLLNNNSYNIDAANIIAGSITTNEIAATTITGNNINTLSISGKTVLFDTGTIGGWTLSSSTFTNTSGGNTTTLSTGVNSFIAGPTGAPTVTISAAGVLAATGVSVSGAITASSGAIGGFSIGATTVSATNLTLTSGAANTANISVGTGSNLAGMNSGNAGSDTAFWAGNTFASRATAPFRVDLAGNLVATSATVNGSTIANGDIYGDGSDGDVTISANTTITRDMFYNNLTVSAGFSLNTGGFRIFVKGTCTIEATASIQRNGNDASGSTGGAALAIGSVQGALAGKDGGGGGAAKISAGAGTAVNGDNGSVGSAGVSVAKSLVTSAGVSLAGKTSGNGGGGTYTVSGGTGQIGGAGGSITGTVYNQIRTAMAAYNLFDIYPESGSAPVLAAFKTAPSNGGASGGASGGARQEFASGGSSATSGYGGYGGGGGGQAGIVSLFARVLVNNGTISANGGNAANGQNGGNGSVDATLGGQRNAGGGGGGCGGAAGNGGVVIAVYGSKSGSGTITASAGTLGTKGLKGTGAGGGGATGADGTDGQDGVAGNAGTVIELVV